MGKRKLQPTVMELQPLKGQRQNSESDNAIIACNDYLRLGIGRTIPLLLEKYEFTPESTSPTKSLHTLYKWHNDHDWKSRAALYDTDYENIKNAERLAAMEYGIALDYERVNKLKRLAAMLEAQIYERGEGDVLHNIWVQDVKQIGYKENAERVEIERFNAPLISEYRAVLDDLAKETGGRKQKTEIGNLDNLPLSIRIINRDSD